MNKYTDILLSEYLHGSLEVFPIRVAPALSEMLPNAPTAVQEIMRQIYRQHDKLYVEGDYSDIDNYNATFLCFLAAMSNADIYEFIRSFQ